MKMSLELSLVWNVDSVQCEFSRIINLECLLNLFISGFSMLAYHQK